MDPESLLSSKDASPLPADDMLRDYRAAHNKPPVPFSKHVDDARKKKKIAIILNDSKYMDEAYENGFEVYWRHARTLVPYRLVRPSSRHVCPNDIDWVYIPRGANFWEVFRETRLRIVQEDETKHLFCMRCIAFWCICC